MTTLTSPITFDWGYFSARYAELAYVGLGLAQLYFGEAQLYCDNTSASPVQNLQQRYSFLHMITAHIAQLNAPAPSGPGGGTVPSSPLVGRISSATEGSVTVQAEMKVPEGVPQFWAQTKYGIAFWAAAGAYRNMFYIAGPRRSFEPYPFRTVSPEGTDPVNPAGPYSPGT